MPAPTGWTKVVGLLSVGCAAWCAQAFFDAGHMYLNYWQPAISVLGIPPLELVFDAWYLAYGLTFVWLLALGTGWSGAGHRLVGHVKQALRWRHLPALLAFAVGAMALLVRLFILERHVITDDEEVYLFIARTLLEGRLVNPLPEDPQFFENQFVVLNERGWFGKYPIGHPLVLALALAFNAVDVVLPLVAGLTTWLTWTLGRQLLGPRRAALGVALVALSPHFTWTHATLLSQPTSCLAMMLGLVAMLHWSRSRRGTHAALAGAAFGFCILARPAPGVLMAGVGLTVLFTVLSRESRWRAGIGALTAFVLPLLVALAVHAWVHTAQSGSPLHSGYHTVHSNLGIGEDVPGQVGQSLFGGLLRENFWLFGWPLSLLPVFVARPRRGRILLYGPIVAELVYRISVPKTVVSTTGPTYLMEAVPLLALLAADGLARASLLVRRLRAGPRRELVPLLALASVVASLVFFVPVQMASIRKGVEARSVVFALLEQAGVERALVFSNALVDPTKALSWAYYPPSPSPDLDEPLIFVRWPSGEAGPRLASEFWERRFADRPAFLFVPGDEPRLIALEAHTGTDADQDRPARASGGDGG